MSAPTNDPLVRVPPLETTQLLRQQESLRQIIESISTELELEPLLARIIFYACELLHAENGTIGLVDEAREVVRTAVAHNMPAAEQGAENPPGVGLFGHIYNTHQPLILNRYGNV